MIPHSHMTPQVQYKNSIFKLNIILLKKAIWENLVTIIIKRKIVPRQVLFSSDSDSESADESHVCEKCEEIFDSRATGNLIFSQVNFQWDNCLCTTLFLQNYMFKCLFFENLHQNEPDR